MYKTYMLTVNGETRETDSETVFRKWIEKYIHDPKLIYMDVDTKRKTAHVDLEK